MKIAIVHEWLDGYAGSERVLEQLFRVFPQADLYAVCDFLPDDERSSSVAGCRAPPSSSACPAPGNGSATTSA
jgi:hypothetical protein